MNRLENRVAIVTGTGDGIGRGIALAFAREGATLAICDLNLAELLETEQMIQKTGTQVLALPIDLRDVLQISAFVERTAATFGRIDCLVNNAAVMPVAPTETIEPETVDQILQVNLRAPILFTRFAIPHMRRAGGGSVIHMASVTGHLGHPGITVYGATKGGLIALARGQAVELAVDHIRVNTVSPGTVDSPMLHRFLAENATDIQKAREAFDRLHPRGKVGSIEEVAAVFVFLASDEAANITATDIRCDGGYGARGHNQLHDIATMIQLFDSVYLLDGTVGKRPIYLPLLVSEWGCLLLDTGCSYHVNDLILPALDRLELRPEQLRYIINTHPDSDHVGGNAGIKHWSPTALLCCGDADRFQIDHPDTLFATRYDAYRPYGVFYSEDLKNGILKDLGEAQPVELTFRGGEHLRLSPNWDVEILSLPGHSKGHLGILDHKHRVLFGGDAIQGAVYLGIDGRPALCPTYLYPETYLLTNQLIEHLDIDLYVSCHWPLKKGSEIAEFCRETREFVERAEILVRSAGTENLDELCDRLGSQLGQWPEAVNRELAYALAGHLKLQ